MTERKGGLGRGLAALIPSSPAAAPGGTTTTAAPRSSAPRMDVPAPVDGGSVAGAVYREVPTAAINAQRPSTSDQ